MTTKEMLLKYDIITKEYCDINFSEYCNERALFLLLKKHEHQITRIIEHDKTGQWFHKAFRQIDVIDAETDTAIWLLLLNAKLFWTKVISSNNNH